MRLLSLLLLVACGRPADPVLEPIAASAEVEGAIVSVAEDGDGAVWLLADHGDGSGAMLRLDGDATSVVESFELDVTPRDFTWFVGAWVVVGSRGDQASFRRVDTSGVAVDGGEPFDGRLTSVAADADHVVLAGVKLGAAVAVNIDREGTVDETWEDLEGVRASDVAILGAETYIASEQLVGGSQILRRGPDGDTRTQVSLIAETLTPVSDERVYVGGFTVAPSDGLPAFAWLGADLSVQEIALPVSGGEGEISASVPWSAGGIVRAERGGIERASDEVVIAVVRPSDAVTPPSRWAQPLGSGAVEVSELFVMGGQVLVVGSVDGGAAWWMVSPPA